jgi:DnaJ-class molecular chaperone
MGKTTKGDLYVKVNVKVPTQLNEAQKKMLEELSGMGL